MGEEVRRKCPKCDNRGMNITDNTIKYSTDLYQVTLECPKCGILENFPTMEIVRVVKPDDRLHGMLAQITEGHGMKYIPNGNIVYGVKIENYLGERIIPSGDYEYFREELLEKQEEAKRYTKQLEEENEEEQEVRKAESRKYRFMEVISEVIELCNNVYFDQGDLVIEIDEGNTSDVVRVKDVDLSNVEVTLGKRH